MMSSMHPRGSSNSPQFSRNNYYSSHSNRNRGTSKFQSSSSSPTSGTRRTMNFKPDFIYKGGNKKEWSTLQSKINQKLKHENISYILDPAEVARRKTPPPPVIDLPPPMHYIETPQEKEIRAREQANLDEDRKEKKKDFDRWQEKFAVDFAKGMDCIYQLVSQTIITDLDRTLEQLTPVTRDPEIQFFTIFRRLEDKWGPTSKKDAVEIVRLIHALQGDYRGWDIYLVGLDSLGH